MVGEAVDVIRPGAPTGELDEYRNPIFAEPAEHVERGAAFAPASLELITLGRDTVTDKDALYFHRPGVDILSTDRVRVRGIVREVDGNPERWVRPGTGREIGLVVRLKAVSG